MPVLALHPPFDTVLGMVLDILHALYIYRRGKSIAISLVLFK